MKQDLYGGQAAKSETNMVHACEEEMHGHPSARCERLVMDGFRIGSCRLKKYWER